MYNPKNNTQWKLETKYYSADLEFNIVRTQHPNRTYVDVLPDTSNLDCQALIVVANVCQVKKFSIPVLVFFCVF